MTLPQLRHQIQLSLSLSLPPSLPPSLSLSLSLPPSGLRRLQPDLSRGLLFTGPAAVTHHRACLAACWHSLAERVPMKSLKVTLATEILRSYKRRMPDPAPQALGRVRQVLPAGCSEGPALVFANSQLPGKDEVRWNSAGQQASACSPAPQFTQLGGILQRSEVLCSSDHNHGNGSLVLSSTIRTKCLGLVLNEYPVLARL